jgi:hypothetical protein
MCGMLSEFSSFSQLSNVSLPKESRIISLYITANFSLYVWASFRSRSVFTFKSQICVTLGTVSKQRQYQIYRVQEQCFVLDDHLSSPKSRNEDASSYCAPAAAHFRLLLHYPVFTHVRNFSFLRLR